MIKREILTKIYVPIPIIDDEILNDISDPRGKGYDWLYDKSDLCTLGIIYENKAIVLQRTKEDNIDDFKKAIELLLSDYPQNIFLSFNFNMELHGLNCFLGKKPYQYNVAEIKLFKGAGWNKDKFFEKVKEMTKVEDEINDLLNGDASLVMQKYRDEKYDEIISHNFSCLIKEAYILNNSPRLWKKYKNDIDKNGWIKKGL